MTTGKKKTELNADLYTSGTPRPAAAPTQLDTEDDLYTPASTPSAYGAPPGYSSGGAAYGGARSAAKPLGGGPSGTIPDPAPAPARPSASSSPKKTDFDFAPTSAEPTASAPPAPSSSAAYSAPQRPIAGWLLSRSRTESRPIRVGTNRVGRNPDADIQLDDPLVSGFLCNLVCQDGDVAMLVDAEARNLPEVDGKRIYMPTQLQDRCQITLGRSQWILILAPPPEEG
jgi:hypothetical protein